MKRLMLCLSLLFAGAGVFAQADREKTPAQIATDQLVLEYKLDAQQAPEMLKIQERKFRNLSEIEPLKKSNPPLFAQKVRSMMYANEHSFTRLLTEEQEKLLNQKRVALRTKKAELYKTMRAAGASQPEIEAKMLELELASL